MTTDEDKISSIYQQGKEQGPPAHLDAAILRAAHEAVEQAPPTDHPHVVKSPFSGGWRATVSIAAVLIITVILVPLMEQEEPLPIVFDELEQIQKQSQQQESVAHENALLRKEKAKKRVLLNAPKAQSVKPTEVNHNGSLVEDDSVMDQAIVEESLAPMRSVLPAPASVAAGSSKPQQEEVKSEVVGRQKIQLMMDEYSPEDTEDIDSLPPQQWLDNIRQLIEKGEMEAAQKELDAFRLRYPDKKIDPAILDKIKSSR
ncbi:MAG: hypothetical protein IMF15_01135 [Proteobacteria bacterium]|nr:hypothetical protein [Pseudomonadota bacterium]